MGVGWWGSGVVWLGGGLGWVGFFGWGWVVFCGGVVWFLTLPHGEVERCYHRRKIKAKAPRNKQLRVPLVMRREVKGGRVAIGGGGSAEKPGGLAESRCVLSIVVVERKRVR